MYHDDAAVAADLQRLTDVDQPHAILADLHLVERLVKESLLSGRPHVHETLQVTAVVSSEHVLHCSFVVGERVVGHVIRPVLTNAHM